MASLQDHSMKLQFCSSYLPSLPRFHQLQCLNFPQKPFSGKVKLVFPCPESYKTKGDKVYSVCCFCKTKDAEIDKVEDKEQDERPPFDINLAVILAGFAFEAYITPSESVGRKEVDAAGCKIVYLSESFVREIYDGQLFIKLKKGFNLPAMDPWGTSDPYVIMELDGQVVKSKVKWGTKEPTWNEDFTINIKLPATRSLKIAAWDANFVTPHKRMGNAGLNLESLCDGDSHEVLLELEGMGGGGKLQLEVSYKSFDEIQEEKKWWKLPFVSEFLKKNGFESALKMVGGSEGVSARQFVDYAFGQLKSFNDAYILKDQSSSSGDIQIEGEEKSENGAVVSDMPSKMESSSDVSVNNKSSNEESNVEEIYTHKAAMDEGDTSEVMAQVTETKKSDKHFWKNFADIVNQNVVQKLGLPVPEKLKWDAFDLLNRAGLQSQKIAEANYVESGLATPQVQDVDNDKASGSSTSNAIQSALPDIKKATKDLLKQTDSVLGALMVLTTAVSQLNKDETKGESSSEVEDDASRYLLSEKLPRSIDGSMLDEKKAEEMKALFSTAETAMEAWAMLASSLGHPSFIKSEFEKICFLDNESTDTQVAIWRDSAWRRLVVAFRGTEQTSWKDLRTDLMLAPVGLNPERIGGDFKQEVQVHSGFLSAYDSVRIRIISLLKLSIGFKDDSAGPLDKWHVYVTGHSLGGALATLFALELSSSQLAKQGAIFVTMYNFGSPRVGNKRFADVYNELLFSLWLTTVEVILLSYLKLWTLKYVQSCLNVVQYSYLQKVKDSWRVVNPRDIIPTVPRLMGYCHVAQPVYLVAGELKDALAAMEVLKDGYQGDVIGEATPDVLVSEFMKGEKELIEKILQTEINIFRAIRDGSALMQHMEDFYYISLLENVRKYYQPAAVSQNEESSA
ncbi:C2 domain-containing protein [Citrus sinensis]|uniref:C2 domain-containing protein n=1 Tax=Citrus sinensis TaxID=2711 RepID=A0ACB8I3W5_CITSI|nr:C2 domain-containing protein [Citrus sinensis]